MCEVAGDGDSTRPRVRDHLEVPLRGPARRRRVARAKKKACRAEALFSAKAGGAEGDRTPDLVIANDALSQLSYDPTPCWGLKVGGGIVKNPASKRS